MACRVFRNMKTHDLQLEAQSQISNVIFATLPPAQKSMLGPPDTTQSILQSQSQYASATPSQTQNMVARESDTATHQTFEIRFPTRGIHV